MNNFLILMVSLLLTVSAYAAEGQGMKIAVLDKDGSSSAEALLTATLSKQNGVAVLERTELGKIVEEKKLQTLMVSGEFRALGELAGADGILLLETLTLKGGEKFRSARLIATNSGACLFAEKVPDADGQLEAWSALLAARVGGRVAALRSRTSPSAAVAVLNLRSVSGSAQDRELERTATRLLEFGLGRQEKFLLLERRSLAEVMFEKSLDATDALPLLNSQVLVDGSFEPDGANTLTLKLRLRRAAAGDATTLTVSAIPADAKSLAEAALQKLLADFHLPAASVTISGEADEFMREALWAWRARQWDACREALDAAEALGVKAADIYVVRAKTAHQLINDNQKNDDFIKNQRVTLLKSAVRDLQSHRLTDGKLRYFHDDNDRGVRGVDSEISYDQVRLQILTHIHNALQPHDRDGRHDLDDLRRQTREFLGTKDGTFADDPEYPADFALNYRELIAYAERLLSLQPKIRDVSRRIRLWQQLRMLARENMLGLRFAQDDAARRACREMLERLEKDEKIRGRALLVMSGNAQMPEEQAAYRNFLQYLAANCAELFHRRELELLLEADGGGPGERELFKRERGELAITLFEQLPDFEFEINSLGNPGLPDDLRGRANTAFARYCRICLSDSKIYASSKSLLAQNLADMARAFGLNPPKTRSDAPTLTVTSFWHPYSMPEPKVGHLFTDEVIVSGNMVWYHNSAEFGRLNCQIDLPALTAVIHKVPYSSRWPVLASGKLYSYSPADNQLPDALLCYDPATKAVTRREVAGAGKPLAFNDRVFFSTTGHGGALWEWQPQKNRFKLWFSARRKPAQTPLDDRPSSECSGVIHGFNGEPLVTVMGKSEGEIRRLGNDWRTLANFEYSARSTNYGDESLVETGDKILLAGHRHREPLLLIQKYSSPKNSTQSTAFGWELPEEGKFRTNHTSTWMKNYAYHRGVLFRLERDTADNYYLRRWQLDQPGVGEQIALTFVMSAADADKIIAAVGGKQYLRIAEETLHPETDKYFLRLITADSGLVLTGTRHCFWFIPYEDLEEIK